MAHKPGSFERRPDVVARERLIWRTWLTHRALGYVPTANLNVYVARLLCVSVHNVHNVVNITKPDGCYS